MKSNSHLPHLPLLLALTATTSWAAPLSGGAAHPLVDMESGILLGGSQGGRWVKATALGRSIKGGESYRVYGARGLLFSAQGAKPSSEGAPCENTLFLDVKPPRGEFAVGANWNALPRTPREMSTTQPAYRAQIAALLKKNGIARPTVRISQVWRVDLDGDGQAEVLLSANNHGGKAPSRNVSMSPDASAGDYALVLLRKMVRGQLKTMVLASEYHPKFKKFNAPGTYRLAGVLDANGDGKMEVVLRGRYYEGIWTSVHEVRGDKAIQVLSEGCGA